MAARVAGDPDAEAVAWLHDVVEDTPSTADPLAVTVKRADLADNSDPERVARLDPETRARLEAKYAHARELLR
ncbi:MAG: hypothetical protein ABI808_13140 [Pseudonocardiales bacterium]